MLYPHEGSSPFNDIFNTENVKLLTKFSKEINGFGVIFRNIGTLVNMES